MCFSFTEDVMDRIFTYRWNGETGHFEEGLTWDGETFVEKLRKHLGLPEIDAPNAPSDQK